MTEYPGIKIDDVDRAHFLYTALDDTLELMSMDGKFTDDELQRFSTSLAMAFKDNNIDMYERTFTPEERFAHQIAHLSKPDILPRFIENGGSEDPRDYLEEGGGGPDGSTPYLYEFVCADLKIEPLADAVYIHLR